MIASALFWAQYIFTPAPQSEDLLPMRFFSNSGLWRPDPAMRHHLRLWQPQLRSLFVMRIKSFEYRHRVPGYELPEVGRTAQHAYDDRFAAGRTLSVIETR
jgi:hypothetical protein